MASRYIKKCLVWLVLMLPLNSAWAGDLPRRIVTGLDACGKAVVLFNSRIEPKASAPGRPALLDLWTTHRSPADVSLGADFAGNNAGLSPPDGGSLLRVVDLPPTDEAQQSKLPVDFMMKMVGEHAPKRGRPPIVPGMNRTRSVDYAIILSGAVDLMLDDTTVHLKAGDVVVQQAVNHAWINRGPEACRILFVLLDSSEP